MHGPDVSESCFSFSIWQRGNTFSHISVRPFTSSSRCSIISFAEKKQKTKPRSRTLRWRFLKGADWFRLFAENLHHPWGHSDGRREQEHLGGAGGHHHQREEPAARVGEGELQRRRAGKHGQGHAHSGELSLPTLFPLFAVSEAKRGSLSFLQPLWFAVIRSDDCALARTSPLSHGVV